MSLLPSFRPGHYVTSQWKAQELQRMPPDHRYTRQSPHPRDLLDYQKLFAEYPQFDASMPMEMLNFFPNLRFKKVVTIFTEVKGLPFADEAVRLGPDFMDAYEDPLILRQNEQI